MPKWKYMVLTKTKNKRISISLNLNKWCDRIFANHRLNLDKTKFYHQICKMTYKVLIWMTTIVCSFKIMPNQIIQRNRCIKHKLHNLLAIINKEIMLDKWSPCHQISMQVEKLLKEVAKSITWIRLQIRLQGTQARLDLLV
jgi:hypothetical protein